MTPRRHRLDWSDERLDTFWSAHRHASLTTLRRDGAPHTVPVAPVVDREARAMLVLTSAASVKARNVEARGGDARVTLCEIDGRYWVTVEGHARVERDSRAIAAAERRYAERFRPPRVNPDRVILVVEVDRVLGNLPD